MGARRLFLRALGPALQWLSGRTAPYLPLLAKRMGEFGYWARRAGIEGTLDHGHYERHYTRSFGLERDWYRGKRIVDLGCGPRGSLEWAPTDAVTIGVDPLSGRYRHLSGGHAMHYVAAVGEALPLETDSVDVLTSFNSLDHCEDPDRVLAEIRRVTRPGGKFLLIVEIEHDPTPLEPHRFGRAFVGRLSASFEPETTELYPYAGDGIYRTIEAGETVPDVESLGGEPGILLAAYSVG